MDITARSGCIVSPRDSLRGFNTKVNRPPGKQDPKLIYFFEYFRKAMRVIDNTNEQRSKSNVLKDLQHENMLYFYDLFQTSDPLKDPKMKIVCIIHEFCSVNY